MAEQVIAIPPAPFGYVLLDGDSEHPRTVRASDSNTEPWIEPEMLKLGHRIGRGLLGSSFLSSDLPNRLGTPNYMAPEQWQPEVRGPISFETDSWGFGCTILEMLVGIQPCSLNALGNDGDGAILELIQRNQGNDVGLDRNADNGFVLEKDHGVHGSIRVHASALDHITNGLEVGDWVRLKEEDRSHSPVGLLIFRDEPNKFLVDWSEVDAVSFSSCRKMIEKYQHVEDHHWTVRLVLIAFGFLTVVKLRMLIGKKMGRKVNPIHYRI
ncbi:unnamed protein product [Lupinus luteus]|uniref:Protein kinase domain-containing protein n=1 Tax=Lupinus luteus TaxID=3873 RepID=A0AAV1Y0U7_LUPLU